ncbi:PO113 protein, partial [Oenanthe oenanthe]|nr:PO113 protein [Oenanthe oenanthe]
VTFLGVKVDSSYVSPPAFKIRCDVKTLHDVRRLVGSLQWLRITILIPPEVMSPLYDLSNGKYPWES